MGQVDHPFASEGVEVSLNSTTDQVLALLKSVDLEKPVETPFGEMPGGQFIMVPIADMIIHTWDMAKATGQSTTFDNGLAEVGYNVMVMAAPLIRGAGGMGPEIVVPASASFQDRMLGLSGRQP